MSLSLSRYRTILAAILLLLYCFIAAPVQLWHHHQDRTCEGRAGESKEDREDREKRITAVSSFFKAGSSNGCAEEDCAICSHHYAVHFDDAIHLFLSLPARLHTLWRSPVPPVAEIYSCLLPNKGPPAA